MLQACVNGPRAPSEHPALPSSSDEIAAACADSVAAGATDLHVHPKDGQGMDTLNPSTVAETLDAVRAACPGVTVGVTTGAWAAGGDRLTAIQAWALLPDHASVNFHEPGAANLARLLLHRGIAVDAGLYSTTDGCDRLLASGLGVSCRYLLVELTHDDVAEGLAAASTTLRELARLNRPVLLHGEDATAWPVLQEAVRLGLAIRIGLEDVLTLPDGSPARDNADLIRVAQAYLLAGSR